jgi:dTDP-4-dehydrorhamnose reductase
MRVAVTGATGRLGQALVAALADAPFTGPAGPIAWDRAAFDLDAPDGIGARMDRDRPEVVVHAAAWADVDGCARDPGLALIRNGHATGVLARACAERGLDLAIISTNEVFDGTLPDGATYAPDAEPNPINPYGASKLAAERAATAAYIGSTGQLGIVRTAWLFGSPDTDFPGRILAAATRARDTGQPLKVVADEWGTPTYTHDLSEGIVDLLAEDAVGGTHHIVNGGIASRADWARDVLARAGLTVETQDVASTEGPRPSTPPLRAILAPPARPLGAPLRPWPAAMADYAPALLRAWQRSA